MGSGVKEECRLCRRKATLCRSHVLPDFFYREISDENNRAIAAELEAPRRKRVQTGPFEHLLCSDCEVRLSRLETYGAKVLRCVQDALDKCEGDRCYLRSVDYKTFKLFQLSLLWRSSVSTHRFFDDVSLGDDEERLRQMVLRQEPGGQSAFSCTLAAMDGDTPPIMRTPVTEEFDGSPICLMLAMGLVWIFALSEKPTGLPTADSISEDGVLPVCLPGYASDQFMANSYKLLADRDLL